MLQFLSRYCKIRKASSINTLKFTLNINIAIRSFRSEFKQVDLLEINRKNMQCATLLGPQDYKMPVIGIGTWKALEDDVYNAVLTALDVGYRHIDTAYNYNNEEQIGKAVNEWIKSGKGTRSELFITTKLPSFGNRPSDVAKYLKLSLQKLNLDYVDLYLIHMPFAFLPNEQCTGILQGEDGSPQIDFENDHLATWKAMESQVKSGLARSIGLSNFNEQQLKNVYENAEVKPAVMQVEMHAHLQQNELLEACRKLGVVVTAYAPLGSPGSAEHFQKKYKYEVKVLPSLLQNPTVLEIAKRYNKFPSQILLRHLVQRNVTVIPKSRDPKRIEQNYMIFDFSLDNADMEKLNALDKKEEGRTFDFLFFKGVEKHPHYPFNK